MSKVICSPRGSLAGLQPASFKLKTPERSDSANILPPQTETLLDLRRASCPTQCSKRALSVRPDSPLKFSRSLTLPGTRITPLVTHFSRGNTPAHTQRAVSDSCLAKNYPRTADPHQTINLVEVEYKFLASLEKNFTPIKQAFQIVSSRNQAQVTLSDFRRILEAFCMPLTDEQFEYILHKVPRTCNNAVDYKKFLEQSRSQMVSANAQRYIVAHYRRPESAKEKYDEIESRLRIKISSQLPSVLKALRLFDYNRDGYIQRHDLKRILEALCSGMTDSCFERLCQKNDVSGYGHSTMVNYLAFFRRLGVDVTQRGFTAEPSVHRGESPAPVQSKKQRLRSEELQGLTLSQVEKKFREAVLTNYGDINRTFVAFDKRRDGFVTLEQLKRVLTSFTFPVSDSLFAELMTRCGVRATHKIAYDQFLEKFQYLAPEGNGQAIPIKPSHKFNPIRESESPLTTERICQLLEKHVTENFSSVKEAFLAVDDDKDGLVKRKDLKKTLEIICPRITSNQVREVMNKLDSDLKGFVTFHEFLDHFEVREGKGAHPWLSSSRIQKISRHPNVLAWKTVEDVLRDKLSDNWRTIAKAFTKADDNKDGTISKEEMRKLLGEFALPISDEHFRFLWDRCDENHNGAIEFDEFLKKLGVNISSSDLTGFSTRITEESEAKVALMKSDQQQRLEYNHKVANARTSKMSAEEVIGVLRERIGQKSADLRKTFLSYDSDADGKLSKKEFRMVLANLGMVMSDAQYNELTKKLNFYRGSLPYSDFLAAFQHSTSGDSAGSQLHISNHRFNQVIERQDPLSASEVEEILRKKITEGFQDLRHAFAKVDDDHDGLITIAEFRRLLTNFMIPMDDKNFTELVQKLGFGHRRPIDYHQFLRHFQSKEDVQRGHPWLFSENKVGTTLDMKDLSAEEAHAVLRTKAADQWHDIATAYRRFDRDGNGIVTKKELKGILHRFNISISKEEFAKLWNAYDTDKNKYIDHEEFLTKLGIEFAPGDVKGLSEAITKGSEEEILRHHQNQKAKQQRATENQVNIASYMSAMEIETRLRDLFRDSFPGFRKAFEKVDSNQDGYISRAELLKVLHSYHLFIQESELKILLNRVGLGSDDRLPYTKFLAAFEDPRLSGNSKLTLERPAKPPPSVVFESAENLSNEEMMERVRKKVATNSESIKQAFIAFDASGAGRVTRDDLHQLINSFCCQINSRQFKFILGKINVYQDGTIDCKRFIESFSKSDTENSLKWLEAKLKKDSTEVKSHKASLLEQVSAMENEQQQLTKRKSQREEKEGDQGEKSLTEDWKAAALSSSYECIERLSLSPPDTASKVEKSIRPKVAKKWPKLAAAFKRLDVEQSGLVGKKDFKEVMQQQRIDLSDGDMDLLWNKYDTVGKGKIQYGVFLKKFALTSKSLDEGLLGSQKGSVGSVNIKDDFALAVLHKIHADVVENWKGLRRAFRAEDKRGEGYCTLAAFTQTLRNYNIDVSQEDVYHLSSEFDSSMSGKVSYNQFLRCFFV